MTHWWYKIGVIWKSEDPGNIFFIWPILHTKLGDFGKVRIRGNTHNKKTQTVFVPCSLVGWHPYIVSPFAPSLPLLSLKWGFVLGISVSLHFFFEHPKKKKPESHKKSVQPRALWASSYDTSPSVFNHQTNQISNINFTNEARIDRPITDHLPMTKHLFISSSSVLHFEWFKMLSEGYLKL
jgi:hypothetical protein